MSAMSESPAMIAALQQIEANGKAWSEMNNRVQNDTRYRVLMAYSLALDDADLRSAGHVMASLGSSQHHRAKRAAYLATAREGQIKGLPGYTQAWLKRAADRRRVEVSFRAPEQQLAGVAADLCAALWAPYQAAAE